MKDIKAIKGKFYIQRLIEEGEHEHQDFKFAISDARKIARSISAFANNDGGRLLIGVKDNGNIAGVRNEEDIYMIEQAAQMYCRPPQNVDITAFKTEGSAIVLRATIAKAQSRPVKCQEPDGSWKAYYRVKDENILAPSIMIRVWQQQKNSRGQLISLSPAESHLLQMIERNKAISIDDYAHSARISLVMAQDIAVKLAAMGIITFQYNGSQFLLTHSTNE